MIFNIRFFKHQNVTSIPLIFCVQLYRFLISPLLPRSCRFYPSCSAYAIEALQRFGPVKGSILAIKRIVRCNPFNYGGYDPVPGHVCDCSELAE